MKVLITGGAGFVGQRLAAGLLEKGSLQLPQSSGQSVAAPIERIVCFDQSQGMLKDPRIEYVVGDIAKPGALAGCLDDKTMLVYHLAAVVSGTAEADFDLGMAVNLDGTRDLLDRCRALGHRPRVVFSSSIAVFGGELPAIVTDDTTPMPQGSYGIQKHLGELLVQDYSRKGFIDGCSLRLPTVVVRPGKPNGAASSFASGILREPLAGVAMTLPVDPATLMWSASPRAVVHNLIHAAQMPAANWGQWRSVNLPGRVVSMQECLDALERIAGKAVRELVKLQPDEAIQRLVSTWPGRFDTARALSLGFVADADFEAMLRAYIEDNPEAIKVPVRL